MGPTAVMALMTHQYVQLGGAPYAIVLSFLAGCIELLAGLLNLGTMAYFMCCHLPEWEGARVSDVTLLFKS